MKDDTLLLIAIGGALILLTDNPISKTIKGVGEGITTASSGLGQGINEIGQGIGSPFAFVDTIFDRLSDLIKQGGNSRTEVFYNTIGEKNIKGDLLTAPISFSNPINSISKSGQAYNLDIHTVTSKAGQKTNILAAPNTYIKSLGIGFDTKGQGYSSAFANKDTKSTNIFKKIL